MKAVKANKQYTISETEKSSYLAQGYDILDDDGTVIERSPQATVLYSEYEKLLNENAALKTEIEQLKAEIERLKAEGKKKKGETNVS